MRFTTLAITATLSGLAYGGSNETTQGFDITGNDTDVDFVGAYNSGARYVSIMVTENTDTIDELGAKHWQEAKAAGLITQAVHRADPRKGSPKEQLDFFLAHGGDWQPGNLTLPGVLEILPNPDPDQDPCYGLESDELASYFRKWGDLFFDKYAPQESVLRVNAEWLDLCTYTQDLFHNPVWMACNIIDYVNTTLPDYYPDPWVWKFWQNADTYEYGGKSAIFYWHLQELKQWTK